MPPWFLILVVVAASTAALTLALLGGAGYGYELREDGLWLLRGGLFPQRLIRYSEIAEARRATFPEFAVARRYGFNPRYAVLLRLTRGFWRLVVVTPPQPDEFLRQLHERLSSPRHA